MDRTDIELLRAYAEAVEIEIPLGQPVQKTPVGRLQPERFNSSACAAQQAIFDQGNEVGQLAKSLRPGGIEISADATDFEQVLRNSLEATQTRKPLFEAGFVYNGGYARADILNPVGKDAWDLIEVKSSTEVKDVNLLDLAFQAFVYEGAGLRIRRCCLMHVDRDYVRQGPIEPEEFFTLVNATKDVSSLRQKIKPQLEDMLNVIGQKNEPVLGIGPHCSDPYPCPLQDKCWAFLPADNVFNLYYGGRKCWRLFGEGIIHPFLPVGSQST